MYDEHFILRGPGYHPEQHILVHGLAIEPILMAKASPQGPIIEPLAHASADSVRWILFSRSSRMWLMAWQHCSLAHSRNHFVREPKASLHIDANQAGVGKTWFALATGAVLDGQLPDLIHYLPDDEELAKRILSNLRQRPTSVLIIDNAKNRTGAEISSPCLEANSMAPHITLRILGKSINFTQPNDVLWFLTMNQTKVSPDLASRGMPIRLYYEGDPAQRVFAGPNPLEFAIKYRRRNPGRTLWDGGALEITGPSLRCSLSPL